MPRIDAIDWRNKTLRYLSLFMGSDMAEPEQEEILNCMTNMTLQIENILAQTDGEDRCGPDNEGPRESLPDGILE